VPPTRSRRRFFGAVLLTVSLVALARAAHAQSPGTNPAQPEPPGWEFRLSGNLYFLPDEENYLQPTITADRDALHLESRYRYEDAASCSVFGGWNLAWGKDVKLALTPMFGGLFGHTNGVIPAFEGDLTWSILEFYSEGEYVIDVDDTSNSFFYSWSEFSLWPTDWLRVGGVFQRTRAFRTPRDVQRGLLVGTTWSKIEGTFYSFNPGSDERFYVLSIGVKF